MSTARAHKLAERCFALARSTTFAGERDAAIARGTAIAEKANLDLDSFDIPGRARRKRARQAPGAAFAEWERRTRPAAERSSTFEQPGKAPASYSSSDVAETMASFHAAMAAQRAEFITAADAARRLRDAVDEFVARAADRGSGVAAAFECGRIDAAMVQAAAFQAQRSRWPDIKACADYLFSRGTPVYDLGDDELQRWLIPGSDVGQVDDDGLRDLADTLAGT